MTLKALSGKSAPAAVNLLFGAATLQNRAHVGKAELKARCCPAPWRSGERGEAEHVSSGECHLFTVPTENELQRRDL